MGNLTLSEIDGFYVGHAENRVVATGCTAILTPQGAVASAFTPGFAPGSREMEMLRPESAPQAIHGLLLAGGSAFGLVAAAGIMAFLREKGAGLEVGDIRIPLVPGAVIFDYPGNKSMGLLPDEAMGYKAAASASRDPLLNGPYGAGLSAAAGKVAGAALASPSGIGSFGFSDGNLQLAALAVVNSLGSIINPENGEIVSGVRRPDQSLAMRAEILDMLKKLEGRVTSDAERAAGHTVLVVIGTNARMDKLGAYKLSRMAAAGIARAVFPAHLLYDGDTVFALSSCTGPEVSESWLGALAADAVSRAIVNAVCFADAC